LFRRAASGAASGAARPPREGSEGLTAFQKYNYAQLSLLPLRPFAVPEAPPYVLKSYPHIFFSCIISFGFLFQL